MPFAERITGGATTASSLTLFEEPDLRIDADRPGIQSSHLTRGLALAALALGGDHQRAVFAFHVVWEVELALLTLGAVKR